MTPINHSSVVSFQGDPWTYSQHAKVFSTEHRKSTMSSSGQGVGRLDELIAGRTHVLSQRGEGRLLT